MAKQSTAERTIGALVWAIGQLEAAGADTWGPEVERSLNDARDTLAAALGYSPEFYPLGPGQAAEV